MHGAPSKSTAQLPLAEKGKRRYTGAPGQPRLTGRKTGHCTCKQGPLQKHSQLNHTTVRSCKKKKMSRKLTSPLN